MKSLFNRSVQVSFRRFLAIAVVAVTMIIGPGHVRQDRKKNPCLTGALAGYDNLHAEIQAKQTALPIVLKLKLAIIHDLSII